MWRTCVNAKHVDLGHRGVVLASNLPSGGQPYSAHASDCCEEYHLGAVIVRPGPGASRHGREDGAIKGDIELIVRYTTSPQSCDGADNSQCNVGMCGGKMQHMEPCAAHSKYLCCNTQIGILCVVRSRLCPHRQDTFGTPPRPSTHALAQQLACELRGRRTDVTIVAVLPRDILKALNNRCGPRRKVDGEGAWQVLRPWILPAQAQGCRAMQPVTPPLCVL